LHEVINMSTFELRVLSLLYIYIIIIIYIHLYQNYFDNFIRKYYIKFLKIKFNLRVSLQKKLFIYT